MYCCYFVHSIKAKTDQQRPKVRKMVQQLERQQREELESKANKKEKPCRQDDAIDVSTSAGKNNTS